MKMRDLASALGFLAACIAPACSSTNDAAPVSSGGVDASPDPDPGSEGCASAKDCASCIALDQGRCGWCAATNACIDSADHAPKTPGACSGGWNHTLLDNHLRCTAQSLALTKLGVDCRDPSTTDPHCAFPVSQQLPPGSVGAGPTFVTSVLYDGFVTPDGSHLLIAAGSTVKRGGIFSVDLKTGDRSLFSGTVTDMKEGTLTAGSGPESNAYYDIDLGADGKYYALAQPDGNLGTPDNVFQIDPVTGNRTLFIEGTKMDCRAGSVALGFSSFTLFNASHNMERSIAVAGDGTIYAVAGLDDIVALVAVKSGKCRVVSSSSLADHDDANIGSGVVLSDELISMRLVGSTLYAIMADSVISIDTSTGARKLVSSSDSSRITGKGSGIGGGWLTVADAKTFYTFGAQATPTTSSGDNLATVSVDVASGDRTEYLSLAGPLSWGFADLGWVHPSMPGVLIIKQQENLTLYELATGNSNHLSY